MLKAFDAWVKWKTVFFATFTMSQSASDETFISRNSFWWHFFFFLRRNFYPVLRNMRITEHRAPSLR